MPRRTSLSSELTGSEPPPPDVRQLALPAGVVNSSRSASGQVLEGALSVRYRVWRSLEVFAGARSTRYADVGLEVRPTLSEASLIGATPIGLADVEGLAVVLPVVGVVETTHSAEYEGFFLGLGYTY